MTMQSLAGVGGAYWPGVVPSDQPASSSLTLAVTGNKIAMIGAFAHPNRSNASPIRKIRFLPGTIVKAGGSGLTVSLQDVSLTASPLQPDGTPDQTVAVAMSALTSSTWHTTGALSADRTVAVGDRLAVVIEFDGGGRLGADSMTVAGFNPYMAIRNTTTVLQSAGTWGTAGPVPNVVFECADGSVGTFDGSYVFSAISTISFHSGSAADEIALPFTLPAPMSVDGAWLVLGGGTTANVDVVLYSGTTALATVTLDGNAFTLTGQRLVWVQFASVISLAAGTYRLAIKPTTGNLVTIYYFTVASAAELDCMPGGQAMCYSTRVDAGAWTDTTTRRVIGGIRLCAMQDGVLPLSRVRMGY